MKRCCGAVLQKWMESAKPPKWLWRTIAAVVLGGQVATRILKGRILARFLLYLKQMMPATAESPDLAAAPAPQRPGRCVQPLTQQERGGDSKCVAVGS